MPYIITMFIIQLIASVFASFMFYDDYKRYKNRGSYYRNAKEKAAKTQKWLRVCLVLVVTSPFGFIIMPLIVIGTILYYVYVGARNLLSAAFEKDDSDEC